MRVAIAGSGAMGGVFGAAIADAGNDVLLVDVAEALVDHIRDNGLRVEADGTEATHRLAATARPAQHDPVDVVMVFVKGYHTAAAIGFVEPLIGPDTIVVTLQNGWGNADVIASSLDPVRIVIGVTNNSATVLGAGHIAHTGRGVTYVGPYDDQGATGPATTVAAMLQRAGLETELRPHVRLDIWKKLVLNAATLPTAALSGMTAGALGEPGPMRDLVDNVARESVAVARASGYELHADERVEYIHSLLAGAGAGKASMLQDFEAGRRTEIDTVNGAVVAMADNAGVEVPLNRALVALVKGYEQAKGLV